MTQPGDHDVLADSGDDITARPGQPGDTAALVRVYVLGDSDELEEVLLPPSVLEAAPDRPAAPRLEAVPARYRVTSWKGLPNYECNGCRFASLELVALEKHLAERHTAPTAPQPSKPLILGPDGLPL